METRPVEKGRNTIVKFIDGESTEILPKEYSAQSQVHEYGGGAVGIGSDGALIVNDKNTGGVFKLQPGDEIKEIIKGDKNLRFANFSVHPKNLNFILAVQEDHSEKEIINTIALIDTDKKSTAVIVHGADFYSHPKFSPDGTMISWMQWSHPDMPWTGSEVYVANLTDGIVGDITYVAGKAREESVAEPKWHLDGTLLFCSDRTGFWQLYQYNLKTAVTIKLDIKGFENAEVGGREFILGLFVLSPFICYKYLQILVAHTFQ